MRASLWLGAFSLSLLAVAAACSKEDPLIAVATPSSKLETDTGVRWIIEKDATTGTASLAFPLDPTPVLLGPGADAAVVAADFLAKYPETFGVVAADLQPLEAVTDEGGTVHATFVQKANGAAHDFARIAVHFDARGGVDHVSGPFYPELGAIASQTPTFDAAGALNRALAALAGRGAVANGPVEIAPSLDLEARRLHLVYTVPLLLDRGPSVARLDAMTGALLDVTAAFPSLRASGTGVAGRPQTFDIDEPQGGIYAMQLTTTDNRTPISVHAADPSSNQPFQDENLVTSTSPTVWEPNAPAGGEGLAVDVMAKLQKVDGWFRAKVGRLSYDNRRGPLLAFVYTSDDPDLWPKSGVNAAWFGGGIMGFTLNQQKPGGIDWPLSSLDVVGHELMHGITEHTSNLYYGGEPGALNESMSDVFGQLIDHDLRPGSDPRLLGDELDDVIRRVDTPAADGNAGHVDEIPGILARLSQSNDDQGGVHSLSGIPNLVWYLSTVGGTNPKTGKPIDGQPLGWERSRDLWWTLNRFELKRFSSFREAAQKSLQIARMRGWSRQSLGCAWQGVGVLSAAELKTNYSITCEGPDAGESPCTGQKGLVSFCHPTQANAAIVCQDESFIEITLCNESDDAGPISAQRCVGTDGVEVDDAGTTHEAKLRCESVDPTLDSCSGRSDGWYCSQIPGYENSAYSCIGGSRSTGNFCPEGETCNGADGASTPSCTSGSDAAAP